MASDTTPETSKTATLRDFMTPIVAVVIVVIFLGLIYYMFSLLTIQEPQWTRAVYLFTGVEALAFAASGYLFGREVNRARAESAEDRATEAENRAVVAEKEASAEATKGRTFAAAVAAFEQKVNEGGQMYGALGPEQASVAAQARLEDLARLARQLYP